AHEAGRQRECSICGHHLAECELEHERDQQRPDDVHDQRPPREAFAGLVAGGERHEIARAGPESACDAHDRELHAARLAQAAAACAWSRTVSTGHGAVRTTSSVTLPSSMRVTPRRPCVDMTMRSAPISFAVSLMTSRASPLFRIDSTNCA